MVKNPPASARDTRDVGSIPGSGRFPGVATHSIFFPGILSWSEEPGRLQSRGPKVSDRTKMT